MPEHTELKKMISELLPGQAIDGPPPLPAVGDHVYYFYRLHDSVKGPLAAVVNSVETKSIGDTIEARVDLTVFTHDVWRPVLIRQDVPAYHSTDEVSPDVDKWWVWPTRS